MPELNIHRDHPLGLERAREVARRWAEEAESRFEMVCETTTGTHSDTVHFSRSGVKGQLVVAADHFDLRAQLGFLLGVFAKTIEAEIEKNLDELLAEARRAPAPAVKAGGRTAAAPAKVASAKAAKAATAKTAAADKAAPRKRG